VIGDKGLGKMDNGRAICLFGGNALTD